MGKLPKVIRNVRAHNFGRNYSLTTYNYEYRALLMSRGHFRLKNGSWSGGGPFKQVTKTVKSEGEAFIRARNGAAEWVGSVYGSNPPGAPPPPPAITSANQDITTVTPLFATGWARTRPGNPVASLGQFLIELRDPLALPGWDVGKTSFRYGSLWKRGRLQKGFHEIPFHLLSALSHFRSLGSEYLNVVFGWQPFVNDLRQTYSLMKTIDRQIAQIKRDNGRSIRRSTVLVNDTSTNYTTTNYAGPFVGCGGTPVNWWGSGSRSQFSVVSTTKVRAWYVAAYTYYIPDTNSWQWDTRARAALFGVLPTPELVWSVMPWSWLVDWFYNVGDVISNATSMNAVDNLVARYAYIMYNQRTENRNFCQTSAQAVHTATIDAPAYDGSFHTTTVNEMKLRSEGSPYGLGANFGSLSGYQKAVLAALGITKQRFLNL